MKENFEIKIDDLVSEISMLHEVLTASLKLREYEEGQGCAQVFLCEKIEEKLKEIRDLF